MYAQNRFISALPTSCGGGGVTTKGQYNKYKKYENPFVNIQNAFYSGECFCSYTVHVGLLVGGGGEEGVAPMCKVKSCIT